MVAAIWRANYWASRGSLRQECGPLSGPGIAVFDRARMARSEPSCLGGPPIWIGGASEAAMRRVGRSGTGWLGVEGLQDEVTDHLWSIARRAAQDAGRDPDALKAAMRINLEPGMSVDSVAGKLERLAGSGADEAIVDAFAMFPTLDQMLDFASQLIDRWSNRGKA